MEIYHYAELTWPQIDQLPRAIPVVIPCGNEFDQIEKAADLLGVNQVIVLPTIPYGFKRINQQPLAPLQVSQNLFVRVLRGIQRELLGQGFREIKFLTGEEKQPFSRVTKLEITPVLEEHQDTLSFENIREQIVVINTGHTEQHGYHLPLSTDSLIVEAIAQGLQERLGDEILSLPVWPYGVSTHTRQFPGTLNIGGRVFEDYFLAIVQKLFKLGARMIYFSNGHGGNHSHLVNIIKAAGERFPDTFIATEWLHTTGAALEEIRESKLGGMGHGGELETSYILYLRPDLVHMEQATTESDFITTPNYNMDWVEGGRLIANPPWSDDTQSGIYGDGRLGRAEKGNLWLDAAIEEKIEIIQEIKLQYKLRQQKRAAKSYGPKSKNI